MAFNVKSSKSLRSHQAEKLLDILKAKGWTQKSKKSKDFSKTYPEVNMRKIQAIWITMEKAGIIKKRGDLAMNKNVRRMTKKENLNWCDADDCRLLIESLKSWARREKVELDH